MENTEYKLVFKNADGTIMTSSRLVAEEFGKRHDNVIQAIQGLKEDLNTTEFSGLFILSEYVAKNGKRNPEYLMTRDGFSLLVMGFTGKEALQFKLKFIEAFNEMEKALQTYGELSPQLQYLISLETKVTKIENEVTELKDGLPLQTIECKNISTAIRKRGVQLMGGKNANAYQDKSLRTKVYQSLYNQLREQFGVTSYQAIKRKYHDTAMKLTVNLELPLHLKETVENSNNQMKLGV